MAAAATPRSSSRYSAFYRAWQDHGWRKPATAIAGKVDWHTGLDGVEIPADPEPTAVGLPDAGEDAALRAWRAYRKGGLATYRDDRNRPDLDRTSRMSAYLKWGCIHPRTMLADLGPQDETYRRELAWREFYASVVFEWPESARDYYQPQMKAMTYAATPSPAFDAWRAGRTGYPIVDAGMRQLLAQSWMQPGAHDRRFVCTGTDPAPYYRVFNPITQGQKFDPDGDYVRRWVPELRGIAGKAVHAPCGSSVTRCRTVTPSASWTTPPSARSPSIATTRPGAERRR